LSAEKAEANGHVKAWRLSWQLESEERIFGTGERFDSLDQRGRTPDVRVYEEYKQQGARTYFPLPWILSSNGYGLAIDGAARVTFDLGASNSDHAMATIPSATDAAGTWYFGSPKEIIQAYTADSGRPSPMPTWAYGPWMSGNEWDSDERIREVVDRTLSEEVPATVIVIEAWSDESTFYLFNDTEYDSVPGADRVPVEAMRHNGKWPNPKELIQWLHDQGIRVLLWQIPVLKDTDDHDQHRADLDYADEAGLCVGTTEDGTYRNRGWWFPNSRIIDFTNPEARRWWFDKRAYLLDELGVDGFKTDGGEHLWGSDVRTFDGTSGHEAANWYPTRYLGAYHEFMREHGYDKPLTFSRAGFTGSQSFPAHWAGDEDSTWEAYRASLTAGLSAGTSGIAFWGWDLAGFSKALPSAELYTRRTAMAAFTPIMQYHSEHNEHRLPLADRTPWNIAEHARDEDVMSVYRFYARLRMNLVPYLLALGTEAAETGIPLMRSMVLEYPDDSIALDIDDQFFLGSDILVAPVVTPGVEKRRVYLPDDEWWDLWSGMRMSPGWTTVPAPPDRIPVYVRAGACIPLWQTDVIGLGTPVGLPAPGSCRLVLMVCPGTAHRTITDPVTFERWTAGVTLAGSDLTMHTIDAPDGVTTWLRGVKSSASEIHIAIPAGSAETTMRLDRRE
jgi:alpha-glucosidase (family GH31 glycosyl hydrolase)